MLVLGQEDTSVIALYAYEKRTNSDISFEKVLLTTKTTNCLLFFIEALEIQQIHNIYIHHTCRMIWVTPQDDILVVLDKSNTDWWKARNTRTREEGYIPSNYVASVHSLEAKA